MKGPLQIDFEALWQEGMHDWHGNMPKRMVDDALEEAFWEASIAKKKPKQTDPYADIIFQEIKPYLDEQDRVLEIGPGWGNYTFPLENTVQSVTCVDSSASVIAYLKAHTKRAELIHAKFEEVELAPHDVVVGVNCFYRMYYMNQTLRKMNELATKRAMIGMTTGPIQPHYTYLHEKFGYGIKFPRRDYIEIVNMLYQLGIYADCKVVPVKKEYRYTTKEDMLRVQSKKILDATFDQKHVEEALEQFTTYNGQAYCYEVPFYAAMISWEPRKI